MDKEGNKAGEEGFSEESSNLKEDEQATEAEAMNSLTAVLGRILELG